MNRDEVNLFDILNSAQLIMDHVEGVTREEFFRDVVLQDFVIRRIEIMGEAVSRVSPEFRDGNPAIPWKKIKGMRNIMIHRYDDVDMDIVWDSVRKSIPQLIKDIELLIPPPESE